MLPAGEDVLVSNQDFTDEAVLQSLSTLTACLVQRNGSQSSLREVWRQLRGSKRADRQANSVNVNK